VRYTKKRKLEDGEKLRRYHLAVHPKVGELFEEIAGGVSFNVAFEEIVKYIARKKEKATHSSKNSL
jgi:hypothetical protein